MTDPILNDDLAQNLAEMGVNIQPIEVDTSLLADDGVNPEIDGEILGHRVDKLELVTKPPFEPNSTVSYYDGGKPLGRLKIGENGYPVEITSEKPAADKDWPMITEVPGDDGVPVPVATPPGAESNISYSDGPSVAELKPRDVFSLIGGEITMSNVDVPSIRTGNPKDALGDAKVDPSLVPPSAKMYLAAAFADGAAKYGAYNWRENAVRARVYIAAAMRHLDQYLDGESRDPTSKVPHLGHAMACLAILTDATETGNLIDDRPLPGAASDLIRRYDAAEKFGA